MVGILAEKRLRRSVCAPERKSQHSWNDVALSVILSFLLIIGSMMIMAYSMNKIVEEKVDGHFERVDTLLLNLEKLDNIDIILERVEKPHCDCNCYDQKNVNVTFNIK